MQLKKIWAVSHELSWDSERLHRYVGICFGKESLSTKGKVESGNGQGGTLTREEARRLIDDLERYVRKGAKGAGRGAREGQGYREYGAGVSEDGKLVKYATPAQVACLRAEAGRMNWGDGWILSVATRTLKRPVWDLGAIHGDEAGKLINAVRGYVERRIAERSRT
jgi:hypothetical protein